GVVGAADQRLDGRRRAVGVGGVGRDELLHRELGGAVAAAVAAGAVGDDAAQVAVGMPVAAGVLVVGAAAAPRKDGEFELHRQWSSAAAPAVVMAGLS